LAVPKQLGTAATGGVTGTTGAGADAALGGMAARPVGDTSAAVDAAPPPHAADSETKQSRRAELVNRREEDIVVRA
jgi:hypothetical protein